MDPRNVRRTIDNLLADLVRNPSLGRPQSFMRRFGRPLGLGFALGIGSVAGCGNGSGNNGDALPSSVDIYGADAMVRTDVADSRMPDTRDALPRAVDIYGAADWFVPPADSDIADIRDALPVTADLYGLVADAPVDGRTVDTRDALPPGVDIYGADRFVPPDVDGIDGGTTDARDALPPSSDIYGATIDAQVRADVADALSPIDLGDNS